MHSIPVPSIEEVSPESKMMFEAIHKRLGKLPNLYATMGYSPHALKAFLEFDTMLSHGAFTGKQREAIALVVSEVNQCAYCLAAHTMTAMKNGLTSEEILDIRKGFATDEKIQVIVQLAKSIAETKGHAEDTYVERFFRAGFDNAALMELIGLVAVRVFTNYVFAMTNVPIDFPLAATLS